MSNEVVPFEHQMRLAEAFAKSGLFGVKTTDQALALMALCEGEGLHPAKAVQEFHIIQGRPALRADAMLARFQRSGGSVAFTTYTDQKVEATFTHPQGGSLTVDWTIERAKQAKLTTEMWSKYPRQMLRSRVISEGVRSLFPGVTNGLYTEEEVAEFKPALRVDPRPDDMRAMDPEKLDEYAARMVSMLDQPQKDLPRPEAARLCLSIREVWAELDMEEQIQVHDKLNTKQKKALKHICAIDESLLKNEAATIEVEVAA